jgi:hypothetical protein
VGFLLPNLPLNFLFFSEPCFSFPRIIHESSQVS